MKIGLNVLVAAGALMTIPAGCALLTPVPPVVAKAQEVSAAIEKVDELLVQLRDPATTQRSAGKEAEVLALTKLLEQLRADLQKASTVQAQQQAALKAAQDAAVTFGGPYGGLIAAGLGILGVLVQGLVNAKQAHQSARTANETAQLLAGRAPTGRE